MQRDLVPHLTWHISDHTSNRGKALVIHGLNLRPSKMMSIGKELNERGFDVLLVSLAGHQKEIDKRSISFKKWEKEVEEAFTEFSKKNSFLGEKKLVIGYSLGALLLEIYLSKNPDMKVDQAIYFAPAFKIRKRARLIKSLFFLPDFFIIPSFSLKEYRAQKGTSIKAYKALFEGVNEFFNHESRAFKNKTTVFLSKKDEFVSFSKTKKFLEDFEKVSFVELSKTTSSKINPFHHLIIDQDVLGKGEWEQKVLPIFDDLLG